MFPKKNDLSVSVELENVEGRPFYLSKEEPKTNVYFFRDRETISGKVVIDLKEGLRKVSHRGISVALIGIFDIFNMDHLNPPFLHEFKGLRSSGYIDQKEEIFFSFDNQRLPYDSFNGDLFSIKYLIVVRVLKIAFEKKTVAEIHGIASPTVVPSIEPYLFEIGLQDCILLSLELNKMDFFLDDVIIGQVSWKMINLPIERLQLAIERHEVLYNDTLEEETSFKAREIYTLELMDGNPSVGDTIPFRIFLKHLDLTPSYQDTTNRYRVHYYLCISAIDTLHRRYYKHELIRLFRPKPGPLTTPALTGEN